MNTAIPEAASGSQRSSHTRREASTTSNGAASKPIPEGYDARPRSLGIREERATDDPVCFERVDLRPAQTELAQDLLIVLAEQRGMPFVDPLRAPREPHRQGAVAGASDHRMLHLLEEVAEGELRQLGLLVGLDDLADGDAGIP